MFMADIATHVVVAVLPQSVCVSAHRRGHGPVQNCHVLAPGRSVVVFVRNRAAHVMETL